MKSEKKTILRIISIAAVLALIVFVAACQSSGKENNSNDNVAADGKDESKNENLAAKNPYYNGDALGEYNFNGDEFKIRVFQHYDGTPRELPMVEEDTGEPFNDAIWYRNLAIEDRFNVKITMSLIPDEFTSIRNVIKAGDSTAFDIFFTRGPYVFDAWVEGLIIPYDDIPIIDLSKPYWNQSANKTLTLDEVQYAATGDFNISIYEIAHAILFNKELFQSLGLESPYALVNEGKWTFDKMAEMMKSAILDVNGDGMMDKNDRYGYLAHPKEVLPSFWIGANVLSVGKDENDMPFLAMGEEKFISAFMKTYEILWDSGTYYRQDGGSDIPEWAISMFGSGQSLFMDSTFMVIRDLRGMEMDFGIIPYPKYNETQREYVSRIEYHMTYNVPITNGDLERTGIMLEALHSYSSKTILPAFYDNSLKMKSARDDDSQEMLDLIFRTLVIDIGDTTLCHYIRDAFVYNMFKDNIRDIASQTESTERIINNFLNKITRRK